MSKIQTAVQLADACKKLATNYKTLYVLGCIGAPMNATNRSRYSSNLDYNRQPTRLAKIRAATPSTFGFDCVCMIKSLLWGWNGNTAKTYGGCTYKSNGVPDINADQMIKVCKDVTTDFSKIQVGEAVWMKGHIGIYIGDGLAVECTPKWADGVQITAVHNIGTKSGYNGRKWTSHGKLPYVEYTAATETKPEETKKPDFTLNMRTLRRGCEGEDVQALQHLLTANKYPCGTADGIFGSKTETAVKSYQASKNLTADGIVGPATMTCLLGL